LNICNPYNDKEETEYRESKEILGEIESVEDKLDEILAEF